MKILSFLIALAVHSACADSPDAISPGDGFCGLDAARICARQLGTSWKRTSQTEFLEKEPLVNFGAVSKALESLELKTNLCILDRDSFPTICNEFANRDAFVCGIAWIQPHSLQIDPDAVGHFVIVDAISVDRHVRLMDAQSATVSLLKLNDGVRLPLLLVIRGNGQPITVGSDIPIMSRLRSTSTKVYITLVIAVALLMVFLTAQLRCKHWSIVSVMLALSVLGIAGWVTWTRMRDVSPKASFASPSAPNEVKFESETYDFGELTAGLSSEFQVVVFNHSDRPKLITDVRGSCSCMEISPKSFDVEPHSQQVVNVKLNAFSVGFNRFFAGIYVGEAEIAKCEMHFLGVRSLRLLPLSGIVGSLSASGSEGSLVHQLSFDGELAGPIESVKLVSGREDMPLVVRMVKPEIDFVNEFTLAVSLRENVHERGFYYEKVNFEVVCAGQTICVDTEIGVDIVD